MVFSHFWHKQFTRQAIILIVCAKRYLMPRTNPSKQNDTMPGNLCIVVCFGIYSWSWNSWRVARATSPFWLLCCQQQQQHRSLACHVFEHTYAYFICMNIKVSHHHYYHSCIVDEWVDAQSAHIQRIYCHDIICTVLCSVCTCEERL